MPGRYGLMLAIFALLVWLARWLDVAGPSRYRFGLVSGDQPTLCLGLASCVVGMLGRYWQAVRRSD